MRSLKMMAPSRGIEGNNRTAEKEGKCSAKKPLVVQTALICSHLRVSI